MFLLDITENQAAGRVGAFPRTFGRMGPPDVHPGARGGAAGVTGRLGLSVELGAWRSQPHVRAAAGDTTRPATWRAGAGGASTGGAGATIPPRLTAERGAR